MAENIDDIFQDYLARNAHQPSVDFRALLELYPVYREQLEEKIRAHDRALQIMKMDQEVRASDPLIGKTLRGCKIMDIIERGGMSTVYLGHQQALNRNVAVKVLHPVIINSASSLGRFRRESQNIAKLDHENILPVYDVGEEIGIYFVITKYVQGISLDKIISLYRAQSKPPSLEQIDALLKSPTPLSNRFLNYDHFACHVIEQTAKALGYAHEHGVIHRDVKPSNILVKPDGDTVLIDFGLSRDFNQSTVTMTGEYLGTPIYSSPEQLFGKQQEIDARSDVYSLGVTFYELMTGKLPYEGETFTDVVANIKTQLPINPASHYPQIDPYLASMISEAIQKERDKRLTSINDFIRALVKGASPAIKNTVEECQKRSYNLYEGASLLIIREMLPPILDKIAESKKIDEETKLLILKEAAKLVCFWVTRAVFGIVSQPKQAEIINQTLFQFFEEGYHFQHDDLRIYAEASGAGEEEKIFGRNVLNILRLGDAIMMLEINTMAYTYHDSFVDLTRASFTPMNHDKSEKIESGTQTNHSKEFLEFFKSKPAKKRIITIKTNRRFQMLVLIGILIAIGFVLYRRSITTSENERNIVRQFSSSYWIRNWPSDYWQGDWYYTKVGKPECNKMSLNWGVNYSYYNFPFCRESRLHSSIPAVAVINCIQNDATGQENKILGFVRYSNDKALVLNLKVFDKIYWQAEKTDLSEALLKKLINQSLLPNSPHLISDLLEEKVSLQWALDQYFIYQISDGLHEKIHDDSDIKELLGNGFSIGDIKSSFVIYKNKIDCLRDGGFFQSNQ